MDEQPFKIDGARLRRLVEALEAGLACAKNCPLNTTYHERVMNEATKGLAPGGGWAEPDMQSGAADNSRASSLQQRMVSLAARWLEEAANRRKHVAEEKALGGRDDDATVGYCECLEDKAGELKAWAGSKANRQDQERHRGRRSETGLTLWTPKTQLN